MFCHCRFNASRLQGNIEQHRLSVFSFVASHSYFCLKPGVRISLWSRMEQTENDSLLRRVNEDIVFAAEALIGIVG